MAIYHLNAKIISKGKGQSACQSASYIAGEPIRSEALGVTYNNTKPEVVYSNILLCANAPEEYKDRETLWNSVERKEKAVNAQLARSFILALPNELTLDEQIELVNEYAQKNFVSKGMIADINVHDKGDGNPHAHIMLTMREIDENGEWKKKRQKSFKLDDKGERIPVINQKTGEQKLGTGNRKQWVKNDEPVNNWGQKETLTEWRASWAEEQNKYLDKDNQVDHRSLADQGIDREPTRHVGYRKGVKDESRLAENAEIQQANQIKQDIHVIAAQIEETREEKINQRVRVATQKGIIETKTITEMEEKANGDNGAISERPSRRTRLFPEIGTGSVAVAIENSNAGEDFEELQRRTIAATCSEASNTIGATAAENSIIGKTIAGLDIGKILADADDCEAFAEQYEDENSRRERERQQRETAKADAIRERNEKRIKEAEFKFGDTERRIEKDDFQLGS